MKTQKTQAEDNVIKVTAILVVLAVKIVFFLLVYQLLISAFPGLAVLSIWGRIAVAISSIIMGC